MVDLSKNVMYLMVNLGKCNPTLVLQGINIVLCRPGNPLLSDFCIESAIQLSLDFFCATPACECQSPGSIGQECETYAGQCTCIEAEVEQGFSAVHGRQCDLCPFYSYLTPDGCTCELVIAL